MRTTLMIARWIFGIFLCLASIGGFTTGDTLVAFIVLLAGLLLLPPITKVFRERYKTLVAISGSRSHQMTAVSTTAEKNGNVNGKKQGLLGWFTGWGTAIRTASALDGCINSFPMVSARKLESIKNLRAKWTGRETEFIRQRIISGYDKKVNADSVESLGDKYLDFYKAVFPDDTGAEIAHKINLNKVENFVFTKVNDDEALDPGEIQEIIQYSKSLRVSEFDSVEKIRRDYDFYVTNWELDNGVFKGVPSDFVLQKGELCMYRLPSCELLERKTVTRRVNYGGLSYRVKITKGLSYRLGSYNVSTEKQTVDISKGQGSLNLTTKRIIFKGREGVVAINTSAIVDIEPFKDAVVIYKSTGKPFTIKTSEAVRLYQYIRVAVRR